MSIWAREKRQRFQAQKMGKMRCHLLLGVSQMTADDELSLGVNGQVPPTAGIELAWF